jgi:hypothetical protein
MNKPIRRATLTVEPSPERLAALSAEHGAAFAELLAERVVQGQPVSSLRLRRVLAAVLDWAIEATKADFGNIQLAARGNSQLRIAAQRGFKKLFLDFFRAVQDNISACGAA